MGVLLIAAAIVASVAVGVAAERKRPQATALAARRMLTLILYGLVPPVVFFNLAAAEIDIEDAAGLGFGLVAITLAGLLAWWIASRLLRLSRPGTGAVVSAVLCPNSGYLGYPMALVLLGRDELPTAVLYDIVVSKPSLLLGAFAVGAAFGDRAGEGVRDRVRAFFTRNPPLYATIAALLAPEALAPAVLVDASQILLVTILPLGFFAVGATLAENAEHGELPMPPPLNGPVALIVTGRLILAPALLLAIAAPVIDLPTAYVLQAAMPAGLNAMVVAHAYGLDMKVTAEAVVWSTAIVVLVALASLLI